jgi:SOS-response transcriptional repressor LexA
MREATALQLKYLRSIQASVDQRGYPPTCDELALGFAVHPACAQGHVTRMRAKGFVLFDFNTPRSLTLTRIGKDLIAETRLQYFAYDAAQGSFVRL